MRTGEFPSCLLCNFINIWLLNSSSESGFDTMDDPPDFWLAFAGVWVGKGVFINCISESVAQRTVLSSNR